MRAIDIPPALQALADELTAAGIATSIDPTTIPTPGAWLTIAQIDPDRLCGEVSVTADLYLVAPDIGHVAALTYLSSMLGDVVALVPSLGQATPDAVVLPGHPGALPALRASLTLGD